MNLHERIESFWSGERPDRIPYTIYSVLWRHREEPIWQEMFRAGLGVTTPVWVIREENNMAQAEETTREENGRSVRIQTLRTPMGDLRQTWTNRWHDEYLLKTADDYRIMTQLIRGIRLEPSYEWIDDAEAKAQPQEILLLTLGRTPLQTILVDYAGLENFAYHLADFEEAVRDLYDALFAQFRRRVEILAKARGRYVWNLENFTAESLGPRRYEEFLLPVYEECFPILHEAGKIVGCHYDGRTASCRDVIARAPMDLIESLTEPNEGDQALGEARAAWPEKLFWCNIRQAEYDLPADELRTKMRSMVESGSVNGARLAFEVSEQLPERWRESMPVVLETLREMGDG